MFGRNKKKAQTPRPPPPKNWYAQQLLAGPAPSFEGDDMPGGSGDGTCAWCGSRPHKPDCKALARNYGVYRSSLQTQRDMTKRMREETERVMYSGSTKRMREETERVMYSGGGGAGVSSSGGGGGGGGGAGVSSSGGGGPSGSSYVTYSGGGGSDDEISRIRGPRPVDESPPDTRTEVQKRFDAIAEELKDDK